MPPLLLTGGAYQAQGVIANAQRCVNQYPEKNPQATTPPVPVTHYQRPGKTLLGTPGTQGVGRGLYRATNGDLYSMVGPNLYYVDPIWRHFAVGSAAPATNPVSFADNGQFAGGQIVMVDNTTTGYKIDMTTRVMSPIVDPTGLFNGATVVQYLQTFFLFNQINSQDFIVSLPDQVAFDALDEAAKASYADNIVTIGIRQREPWLLGTLTTEPWSLSGAVDFPFEAIPSTFVPHGILGAYSLVSSDVNLLWLTRDLQGNAIFVKSMGYEAKRISTHAIEQEIQKLATLTDCVGSTYQINGHTFIVWTFPSGNLTYAFDLATEQWHQLAYTDTDGNLNRDRALFYANAYGSIVGQDWETGELYKIDPTVFTDNGDPISFIRGFPHVLDELKRITHWGMYVDIQCGSTLVEDYDPQIRMRYSDDRGQTWSDDLSASIGKIGQYDTSPQFLRLGYARDRVYELSHSANALAPLNGVYLVDPEEADS